MELILVLQDPRFAYACSALKVILVATLIIDTSMNCWADATMVSVYSIVTHHERADDAAEAWKECGVCAIGYNWEKNLNEFDKKDLAKDSRVFLKIEKGDLILAYAGENRIAYVGEITDGNYDYNRRNIVGRDEEQNGFGYRHQYKVSWWEFPYDFSRKDLPIFLCNQLGKRRPTVTKIKLQRRSVDQIKEIIRTCARSGSLSYEISEDMIKAGLGKYLRRRITNLEKGLKITKAEWAISKTERPDFLATDEKGRRVIIECKGVAYPTDIDQLARYGETSEDARLMLVAFKIRDECLRLAAANPRIELYECDLDFRKIFPT